MNPKKKYILIAILLLIFAMTKLAMLMWWQKQQPHSQNQANCQITQTACPFGQGASLQLVGVGNHQKPFSIVAYNVPVAVQSLHASFSMRDMDMGFNRFDLQKQADGTWRLDNVRLPLCTESRHDWLIQWQMDGQAFQAAFQTKLE